MFYKKGFSKKILISLIVIAVMLGSMEIILFPRLIQAAITTTGEAEATSLDGGKTSVTTDKGNTVSMEVPPNGVTANTTINIDLKYKTDPVLSTYIKSVSEDKYIVGTYLYKFKATVAGGKISSFAKPIIITLTYTDEQIGELEESTFTINYWDDAASEWIVLETIVDTENNISTTTTDELSYFMLPITLEEISLFAILGEEAVEEEVVEEEIIEEEVVEEEVEEEVEEKPISEMTVEELEVKIAQIQQAIINLLTQLIQLIQSQIAEL